MKPPKEDYHVPGFTFLSILALATQARRKRLSDGEIMQIMTRQQSSRHITAAQIETTVAQILEQRPK